MSAVYRVEEKKCATCRWWNGERGVEFRANKPFYVKVGYDFKIEDETVVIFKKK
ncbi:MAG: hypothetical protein IKO72_09780 [Kiritimatiellae bacterium]|nr:hypothetical protein [Kiritimatiellia bacterium]